MERSQKTDFSGPVAQGKGPDFDPESSGKPLKGFKQLRDMI